MHVPGCFRWFQGVSRSCLGHFRGILGVSCNPTRFRDFNTVLGALRGTPGNFKDFQRSYMGFKGVSSVFLRISRSFKGVRDILERFSGALVAFMDFPEHIPGQYRGFQGIECLQIPVNNSNKPLKS